MPLLMNYMQFLVIFLGWVMLPRDACFFYTKSKKPQTNICEFFEHIFCGFCVNHVEIKSQKNWRE